MEWDERADGEDRDWSIDRFLSDMDQLQKENTALRAEVERLRDERDRQYDQNTEQIVRISVLEAEVERLREERRWRTFPANLPDAKGRYVCMWADGDMYIQWWAGSKWLGALDHEITHWQPLPAPPEKEE